MQPLLLKKPIMQACSPLGKEKDRLCKHYDRKCLIECPECLKIFPCRVCHDKESSHELDRWAVQHIKCSVCGHLQEVSNKCCDCKTVFSTYFCKICTMFDNEPKGQFHCDDCGICRVGGQDNFFHCKICEMCLGNALKDSHRCVERSSKANCPVCLNDLHSSRKTLHVPACGHLIHKNCFQKMLRHGDYRCATCGKSLVEMSNFWDSLDREVQSTPMPEEYANSMVWILCRDCNQTSNVKFHVIGMKCLHCNSYNTCSTEEPKTQAQSNVED